MSKNLSRHYRPSQFKEMVGQKPIRLTLEQEIANDKISHAYLFCGPRGIGKTTTARLLAKAVNCVNRKPGEFEPCNTCRVCTSISNGANWDIIEIDAASNTGVDHVRDHIIANARVAPSQQQYKIFIIDEVHMLSTSAFNALLKTLEEPPEHALFILATTEVHKIPDTIISRCQRFDFRKVSFQELMARLEFLVSQEQANVAPVVLERIARHSGGHVRDAESLLWQILALDEKEIGEEQADLFIPKSSLQHLFQWVHAVLEGDVAASITLVNQMLEDGMDLKQFIDDTIDVVRKLMLIKVSNTLDKFSLMDVDSEMMMSLQKHLSEMSLPRLTDLLQRLLSAHEEMAYYPRLPQLPLEMVAIGFAQKPTEVLPEEQTVNAESPQEHSGDAPTPADDPIAESPAETFNGGNEEQSRNVVPDAKWTAVISGLKDINHSLALTAGLAKILKIADNKIHLAFSYKFHCDRLLQTENKAAVEGVIEKIYGQKLGIVCILEKGMRSEEIGAPTVVHNPDSGTDAELVTALDVFGGKIIPKKVELQNPKKA